MSDVPEDIWVEVLSRLPVVPLIRFRCVSKSWKCLIDSNEFITHHLNHSLNNTSSNLNLVLESRNLYTLDFDLLNKTNRAHFQHLTYPLKTRLGIRKVLGSCHGLLVLSNDCDYSTTTLWNPSVRRFHELPYQSFDCGETMFMNHGFGYDVVKNDYKLVRMVHKRGDDIEVRVCSLKFNSWRRISDVPYYFKHRWVPGELANNALQWNVHRKVRSYTASVVIAFDLGTEEFNLVPLPEFAANDHFLNVFVLGGCLGLMFYVNDNVNIWVMKEYGVQESWSFLFTFELSHDFKSMMPIAYSMCNRKVLIGLDARVLMWYDLDKKSTDLPMIQIPIDRSYGTYYTSLQSLVLLNNGTRDFLITNTMKRQERNAKKIPSTRNDSRLEKLFFLTMKCCIRPLLMCCGLFWDWRF